MIKSSQETENLRFYVKSHGKSDGDIHLWQISKFDSFWGAPGVNRGSKGGQNCPFLIKSSQETENLHFYVKSHEKSDGDIHLWRISKLDSFWGAPRVKRGSKWGQNCPFLIKSSQETENLHFYVYYILSYYIIFLAFCQSGKVFFHL